MVSETMKNEYGPFPPSKKIAITGYVIYSMLCITLKSTHTTSKNDPSISSMGCKEPKKVGDAKAWGKGGPPGIHFI